MQETSKKKPRNKNSLQSAAKLSNESSKREIKGKHHYDLRKSILKIDECRKGSSEFAAQHTSTVLNSWQGGKSEYTSRNRRMFP